MKRASYREAIEYIAMNDSLGDFDAFDWVSVQNLVTARLVAEIFKVEPEKVGKDIVKVRDKYRADLRKGRL